MGGTGGQDLAGVDGSICPGRTGSGCIQIGYTKPTIVREIRTYPREPGGEGRGGPSCKYDRSGL